MMVSRRRGEGERESSLRRVLAASRDGRTSISPRGPIRFSGYSHSHFYAVNSWKGNKIEEGGLESPTWSRSRVFYPWPSLCAFVQATSICSPTAKLTFRPRSLVVLTGGGGGEDRVYSSSRKNCRRRSKLIPVIPAGGRESNHDQPEQVPPL